MDRDAFLFELWSAESDEPWAVVADYMDDRGEPLGAFVRARLAEAAGRPGAAAEAQALARQYAASWSDPVGWLAFHWSFRRVVFGRLGRGNETLDLRGVVLGDAGAAALAACPALAGVRVLDLAQCALRAAGVRSLLLSPHLGALSELDLSWNAPGNIGAAEVASSPVAAQLRWLNMSHAQIGSPGAVALADSSHLVGLEQLWLVGNPWVLDEARRRLAERFGAAVTL